MMHLEAIIERNRKPAPQPTKDTSVGYYQSMTEAHDTVLDERVSPTVSIDAAPVPEYMQGR